MAIKAASSITITRPAGSPISVAGLRNAAVSYQGEAVGAGAVLSSSVPYASATTGLVGWSVSLESTAEGDSASHAAIRAAQRQQEAVRVTVALGDGDIYAGDAYVASFSRGGDPNSAAAFACTLSGTGPLNLVSTSSLLDYSLFVAGTSGGATHLYGYKDASWDDLGATSIPTTLTRLNIRIDRLQGLLFYAGANTGGGVFSEALGAGLAPAGSVTTTFLGSTPSHAPIALDFLNGDILYSNSAIVRKAYDGTGSSTEYADLGSCLASDAGRTFFKRTQGGSSGGVNQYDFAKIEDASVTSLLDPVADDSDTPAGAFDAGEGTAGTYFSFYGNQLVKIDVGAGSGSLLGSGFNTDLGPVCDPANDVLYYILSGDVYSTDYAAATGTLFLLATRERPGVLLGTARLRLQPINALTMSLALLGVGASSATASSTLVSDTFTNTDGTLLNAHTPDTDTEGGGWLADADDFEINSNVLNSSAPSSTSVYTTIIDAGASDCTVSCRVRIDAAGGLAGVCIRGISGSDYFLARISETANEFVLRKFGVSAGLKDSASVTISTATWYTIEIVSNGTSITATLDGANELEDASATENPSGSNVGLYYYQPSTATQQASFDDFEATT